MTFDKLNLSPDILKALSKENYTKPTPIQEQAIPSVLAGKDLLGCAQTGTGKTAAFSLPIVQLLSKKKGDPKAVHRIRSLILSPTRELALQIYDNIRAYSAFTPLRCAAIIGGVSQKGQEKTLERGTDILVATPGRLNDFLNQKQIDLSHVEILVLDEADRMLDMGFIRDVKRIIASVPVRRQTLLFSATMPPEIADMARSLLVNPVKINLIPETATADKIEQSVYKMAKENKLKLLNHLLQDKSIASAIVFTRTKHGADRVAKGLTRADIAAEAIHGDKSQNSRQRALSNFKSGATRVLVATDIAARGIDIDELSHVINFNLPNLPETYVHRIGRTGRAGQSGIAISFCEEEELPYLKDIEKTIGRKIPEVTDHPYPLQLAAQPEKAPAAKPAASQANPTRKPRPGRSQRGRRPSKQV